jgi:hypothetical protein
MVLAAMLAGAVDMLVALAVMPVELAVDMAAAMLAAVHEVLAAAVLAVAALAAAMPVAVADTAVADTAVADIGNSCGFPKKARLRRQTGLFNVLHIDAAYDVHSAGVMRFRVSPARVRITRV